MVMIVWLLDLQISVQSVPITTKFVSSNPAHGEVYSIQHYVIKFASKIFIGNFFVVDDLKMIMKT
jgi:hypothetical protein